jgi:hypothetical protein
MSSIFNKADNDVIISRIHQLNPESKALWGKMTVDQMFKHCNEAIIVAFGENEIKVNFMMRLLGRLLKNKVFNTEFRKNSPTAKEFVFTGHYAFDEAQKEFVHNFARFAQGSDAIKLKVHPFWGPMSDEDWNKLMWNHIDHHLRQFGV